MLRNRLSQLVLLALVLSVLGTKGVVAQQRSPEPKPKSFIQFKRYSAEDDAKILKLYDGLRVADVSDGMDIVGLQDVGLVDPSIHALWKDTEEFAHRMIGIAVTVRYVPTNRRAGKMTPEEFKQWEGKWYSEISSEPFVDLLRPGSVIVIDAGEDRDTGSIGSNNILNWKSKGAIGVVTSGGVRDTDEIIKQRVPMYHKRLGRGIRPGRNEVESVDQPIMCGGVLVRPGDLIVADGDGVVVVPREQAEPVAVAAHQILEADKEGRRKLYEKLGMPADKTVTPRKP